MKKVTMTLEQLENVVRSASELAVKNALLKVYGGDAKQRPPARKNGGKRRTLNERIFDYIEEHGDSSIADVYDAVQEFGCRSSVQNGLYLLVRDGYIVKRGFDLYGPKK